MTTTTRKEKMNRQKMLISSVLVAVAVSMIAITTFMTTIESDGYVYVPSDITKANPDLKVAPTTVSMMTDNLATIKGDVLLSASGIVKHVEDPIVWKYQGDTHGAVPVTILVEQTVKDEDELLLERGDLFTFFIAGLYENDEHFIFGFEPQFELGESVIVHVSKASQGPYGENGDNYFVKLGKYGKYKVVEEMAYNEKFPEGRVLETALNEAK